MKYKTLTFKIVTRIEENETETDVDNLHDHVVDILFDHLCDVTIITDDIKDSTESEIKEFEDERKDLED